MIELWTRIDDCELSTRARNTLINDGFKIIGEVAQRVAEDRYFLMRLPNCGRHTTDEINAVVEPLLPMLSPTDSAMFIDWCLRNRAVLECLRKNWHDYQ